MMRLLLAACLTVLSFVLPAQTQDVIGEVSQNRIGITANFDGSEILIFGAISREAPRNPDEKLDIIITVSGPSTPVLVRKKDRVLGIWVNNAAVEVDAAPSLYKIVTSAPLKEILSDTEDLRHKITIPRAIRSVDAPRDIANASEFTEALIRIRKDNGLFVIQEGAITIKDETLFRAQIALPSNLVEGDYTARMLLVSDRKVLATYETAIDVRKVGLERFIYRLAHDQPMIYGIFSLVIAIAAGWGASAVFRYIRA